MTSVAPGTVDSYRLVSESRLREIYGALDFIEYDPNDPNIVANWPNFPTYHFGPLESFKVNEKTLGGFAMANFEAEGIRGNFGVRIVQTKQQSDGWAVGVPAGTPGAINNPFGLIAPLSIDHDYTDVLPSANIVFDLSDSLLLRFGASRVHGAAGIQPHRADHHVVHAAAVHRHRRQPDAGSLPRRPVRPVGGVVLQRRLVARGRRSSTRTWTLTWSMAPGRNGCRPKSWIRTTRGSRIRRRTASPSAPALYSCVYQIDRPVNGPGGNIQGVELSYQQPIAGGFGVIANYTYSDASSDNGDPVPGNSEEHRQPDGVLRERSLRRATLL